MQCGPQCGKPHGDGGGAQAVLLRDQHDHHLVPAGGQSVEGLGFGVPQRAHGRSDRFSEVSQDRRVQSVGLGQSPGGPGEVSNLTRVDDDHGQRRRCQGCHQWQFQAARSLQQHQGGTQVLHLGDQFPNPSLVEGDNPSLARGTDGNIHLGLGYIDAYVDTFLLHEHLLRIAGPSLQDAGLVGPGNCSGSVREGCGDPRFPAAFYDLGGCGLPHPDPPR